MTHTLHFVSLVCILAAPGVNSGWQNNTNLFTIGNTEQYSCKAVRRGWSPEEEDVQMLLLLLKVAERRLSAIGVEILFVDSARPWLLVHASMKFLVGARTEAGVLKAGVGNVKLLSEDEDASTVVDVITLSMVSMGISVL